MTAEKLDTKLQCKLTATQAAYIQSVATSKRIKTGQLVRYILEDWLDTQAGQPAIAEQPAQDYSAAYLNTATNDQLISELRRRLNPSLCPEN